MASDPSLDATDTAASGMAPDSSPGGALVVHPMTCPCVTKFVSLAERVLGTMPLGSAGHDSPHAPRLVVPGGCDAMRRLGDLLAATYPGRVMVLHMPRSSDERAAKLLARELARLEGWLQLGPNLKDPEAAAGLGREGEVQADTQQVTPPSVDYLKPPTPGGVFVIAGPLSDDSVLRLLDQLGAALAGLESCTSPDRWRPLTAADRLVETENDHLLLAERLLEVGMCPRRSTVDRRAHLQRRLEDTRASAVIYARQSFCDPGAYDAVVAGELARELGIPYLEIEVDFPFDAGGPLRTRVEAFLEAQLFDESLLDDSLFVDDLTG